MSQRSLSFTILMWNTLGYLIIWGWTNFSIELYKAWLCFLADVQVSVEERDVPVVSFIDSRLTMPGLYLWWSIFLLFFIIVIFVSLYLLLFWHNWILSLKPSSHLLIPFEIMSRNPMWPQFKKQEKIQRQAFKRLHKWLGTSTVQFSLRTMHPFNNILFHHDELELNSPFDSDC